MIETARTRASSRSGVSFLTQPTNYQTLSRLLICVNGISTGTHFRPFTVHFVPSKPFAICSSWLNCVRLSWRAQRSAWCTWCKKRYQGTSLNTADKVEFWLRLGGTPIL